MSKLGGKVFSEDTDRDSVGGQVDSIVAGSNVSVDNTDPVNPVVSSTAAGSPTTTLGDLIKRGASADERLPIGTALQVLQVNAGGTDLEFAAPASGSTPTTTQGDIIQRGASVDERLAIGTAGQVPTVNAGATALEYITPAGGGGVTGSSNSIPLAADFLMTGELAGSDGATGDGSVVVDAVKLDFIFFQTQTTITEVSVRSATASSGGTLIVGLHPMVSKLRLTTQDFVANITVSTSSNTTHTETLGTPWVVPAGWYALVTYNDGAGSLTNIIHRSATTGSGIGYGQFISGVAQLFSTTVQEGEFKTVAFQSTTYATTPDLTAVVFNNTALYQNSPAVGEIGVSSRVPMIYLKVQ